MKFDFFSPGINSVQRGHFVNVFFSILSHRHFLQRSAEGTLAKRMPYGLLRDVIQLQRALNLVSKYAVYAAGVQITFYTREAMVVPSWLLLAKVFKKLVGLQEAKEGNVGMDACVGGPGLQLGWLCFCPYRDKVFSPVTVMPQALSVSSPVLSQCIL